MWLRVNNGVQSLATLVCFMLLCACQSTGSSSSQPILVGPVEPETKTEYIAPDVAKLRNANVFLDVAVTAFDPGFITDSTGAIDYQKMDEEGIWPQLRRSEAKLFAVEMKNGLERAQAFSTVRVVPSTNTTADVFVMGKILESDSEKVSMELTVVDATGEILGIKEFEHKVEEGFYRDQRNASLNSYQPLFDRGRVYVIHLLSRLSEAEKETIKNVALMRYARSYNPEAFDSYLTTRIDKKFGQQHYKFSLTGLPSQDDWQLQVIKDFRNQELLFVDRLQDNYDTFYAETQQAYSSWQKETLPEMIARRKARLDRNKKAVLGAGLAVLAGVLASNSNNSGSGLGRGATTAGSILAGIGSAAVINGAFQSNEEMKVQSAIIEEKGQALDLTLSPTEMKFDDQVIELKGTATEQYLQWRQHLREMYQLESTPNLQL
jgi:hypothetical protein